MKSITLRKVFLWALMGAFSSTYGIDDSGSPASRLQPLPLATTDLQRDLLKLLVEMDTKPHEGQTDQKVARIAALKLHKIIEKSCSSAAHKLHTSLTQQKTHPYLRNTLHTLFINTNHSSIDLTSGRIPEELIRNERFYSTLKQTLSGIGMITKEKKDPAYTSLKELYTQLHYYKWLKALVVSQKAFNSSRFYMEPLKGLKENLRLLICSMLNGHEGPAS